MANMRKRIANMRERMAKKRERMANMKERMAKKRERMANMKERIAKKRERIANMREKMVKKRERMANMREGIAKKREGMANMRERIAKKRERMANMREGIAKKRDKIGRFSVGKAIIPKRHPLNLIQFRSLPVSMDFCKIIGPEKAIYTVSARSQHELKKNLYESHFTGAFFQAVFKKTGKISKTSDSRTPIIPLLLSHTLHRTLPPD